MGDADAAYHRLLGIGASAFEALEDNLEHRTDEDHEYRHLPSHRRGIERGTALLAGTVVRGFPKVPRTLVLETGVPAQFGDRDVVAVEEKLILLDRTM